jgi:hypothetical protein
VAVSRFSETRSLFRFSVTSWNKISNAYDSCSLNVVGSCLPYLPCNGNCFLLIELTFNVATTRVVDPATLYDGLAAMLAATRESHLSLVSRAS